jgi:hypothetical protein
MARTGKVVKLQARAGKGRAKRGTVVQPDLDDRGRYFAACRALGHEWKHMGRAAEAGRWNAVGYISNCAHCGTVRTKWVGRSGALFPTTYRYPDGYSRTGDQRLSTQAWRREWVVTVMAEAAS